MTLKNNRAPLLSNIKLYASFHHHMRIQTGVTVRKRLSWVVTSVTLTFDLWPWPFAWTLLLSLVITPENFMMIRWGEHSQKGVTDGRTDGQTDRRTENTICRAAWSQLKMWDMVKIRHGTHNRRRLRSCLPNQRCKQLLKKSSRAQACLGRTDGWTQCLELLLCVSVRVINGHASRETWK